MPGIGMLTKTRRESGRQSIRELTGRFGIMRGRRTKGEKMLAAVMEGPEDIRIHEANRPKVEPGMVRVKLEGCGICASNLPVWEGRPWFRYPMEAGAPGHEGWGIVDEIGPGVSSVSPGDRIAFLSGHAYAEYDVASAESVITLPVHLDGKPFPGEPLGCAVNVVRRSAIRPGDSVAVVGGGFLGMLVAAIAHREGGRVIALSRRRHALETVSQFGITRTVLIDDQTRVLQAVQEMTDGLGCDVVIETAGYQWPLDLAGELTRVRGKLVIAGYHQDGLRQVNLQLWNWRGLDVINAHEREPRVYTEGMWSAVRMVAEGELDPTPLYTHRYTIDSLPTAFRELQEHPHGFVKGLLLFDRNGEGV